MEKTSLTENESARELFHYAIRLDSSLADAYSALAIGTYLEGAAYASRSLHEAAASAGHWARKAVEIDAYNANAQAILAYAARALGKHDEALEHVTLGLASSPNSPLVLGAKGAILLFKDRPSEAREALLMALRLDPLGPRNSHLLNEVAISFYFERDYASTTAAARHIVARYPHYPPPHRWLAASLGQLGQTDEARDALHAAVAVAPDAFNLFVRTRLPWFSPRDHEHMLDGLRKAGWNG
jgi:adenylate cyclase